MAQCCCASGPGYATPLDAMKGPREKIVYIPCIQPADRQQPDYLATVVVDPDSPDYGKVVHRLPFGIGDEVHHTGWNACSSCFGDATKSRTKLIVPAVATTHIYIVDVGKDPLRPEVHKVVKGEDIKTKTGLGYPHTSHCLGSGEIMMSMMGDANGESCGNFVLLDEHYDIKGRWSDKNIAFGYDFWYQPRQDIMISTSYGRPKSFLKCFDPTEVENNYGSMLYFWEWSTRRLIKSVNLRPKGNIPLEVRFLHNPDKAIGFVGCALSSNVVLIYKNDQNEWDTKFVIQLEPMKVEGWALPEMPALITDIVISLDDKYLYCSHFFRGDICQYDITDPHHPVLVGQTWCGGLVKKGSPIKVVSGLPEGRTATDVVTVNGVELSGGPQMIQLSLDGKRLYATDSLISSWDKQFYPELVKNGTKLIQIDVDTEKGGLTMNDDFLVDFGKEPWGPVLAHERHDVTAALFFATNDENFDLRQAGIVQGTATVQRLERKKDFTTLVLRFPENLASSVSIGSSVAINGACLTATSVQNDVLTFDAIGETLNVTNLSQLEIGSVVNYEKAARFGDEIGGHTLSGHIHTVAEIAAIDRESDHCCVTFSVPPPWMKYILSKGFVAIDGVSLTACHATETSFSVYLIPETLRITRLREWTTGQKVNIEVEAQTQAIVDTVERVVSRYIPSTLLSNSVQ